MNLKELVNSYPNKKAFISAVKSELVKLAEAKKTFTYHKPENYEFSSTDPCYYNSGPDASPRRCSGCIFGQALKNLGWTDKEERNYVGSIKSLLSDYAGLETPKYWTKIQTMNDDNEPWGNFLKILK